MVVTDHQQHAARRDVPQIVLVEDDVRARRALQRDLSRAGFVVLCAEDGASAVELYESRGADVLVTDLQMPRMDGLELTLKMGTTHPALPVIAMTGASAPDGRLLSALERGAVSVLAKPFDVADLVETIRRVLGAPTSSDTDDAGHDDRETSGRRRLAGPDADPSSRRRGPPVDDPVNR